MNKKALTQGELKSRLRYEPRTGFFYWISTAKNKAFLIGKKAGCVVKADGYVVIKIAGRRYYAHRLAWLYMTGKWPPKWVDHKNGMRSDNRWKKLRSANPFESSHNRAPKKILNTDLKVYFL